MATVVPSNLQLLVIVVIRVLVSNSLSGFANGLREVALPCYFIFGASYYDNGNNNNLFTLAKANYRPYGIDFPQGATGRFTNGRNTGDFIAEFLGFNNYIPPFANANNQNVLKGVNYASGSSGIRNETGQHVGARIGMDGQLKNHQITISRIAKKLGDDESATEHLSKCLYSVAMGDNDYINNYFLPRLYQTSTQFTPEQYASTLIQQYSQQLTTLHNYGARKVAIFGIPPLGCSPSSVASQGTNGSSCSDKINDAILLFNTKLNALADNLNSNLDDAAFIVINTFEISLSSFSDFRVTNASCCRVGVTTCLPLTTPCSDRKDYVWWDAVHQTEAANKAVAERAYNAQTSIDTYPFDIHHLVQLSS